MGIILFNGISSEEYGIQVEHPPGYNYAERDYTVVHIPGRNGDLIQDNGSFKNRTRSYPIALLTPNDSFVESANKIATWLCSPSGYSRLEDSYEPDYFNLAYYSEKNLVENILQGAGRTTIQFICKPQRFLKSGERTIILENADAIFNPTSFKAKPLLKIYGGTGNVTIGSITFTLTGISTYIMVDCEMQDAYKENQNENSKMTGQFPVLNAGLNSISWTGSITKIEIMPRWWII